MTGKYILKVEDVKLRYEIPLERQITIIRGNSGTGKSTLVSKVRELVRHYKHHTPTGVKSNLTDRLIVIESDSDNWESLIKKSSGKIFVLDEGCLFISKVEFAKAVQYSDNYFLICARYKNLANLTYAVKSVLEFVSYTQDDITYTSTIPYFRDGSVSIVPDVVVTEDSKAGHSFFTKALKCRVVSGHGKTELLDVIDKEEGTVCVIADGAAFGDVLTSLYFSGVNNNVYFVLPESFEWLLLGVSLSLRYSSEYMERPYDFCDTKEYITWERFFTAKFIELCKQLRQSYDKSRVPALFDNSAIYREVLTILSDIDKSVWR